MLAPDDLRRGQLVTINRFNLGESALPLPPPISPIPPGVPLRVLSVSFPFIAVSVPLLNGGEAGPYSLDVRFCTLQKIPSSYLRALRAFHAKHGKKPKPPPSLPADPYEAMKAFFLPRPSPPTQESE